MNTAPLLQKHLNQQRKQGVDFSGYAEHLKNETLPEISPDDIGKYRLRLFLRNKFGATYQGHPVAQGMLNHFETTRKALAHVR